MAKNDSLVSIDFWDTLVIASEGGKKRRQVRHEALCEISEEYVRNLPDTEIEAATQEASEEFHRVWFNQQRTPTAEELISNILGNLGIPATKEEMDYLVKVFEESLMDGPPELVPDAKETIAELDDNYKLALISDTMYSPGRVLRQFLDQNDLIGYFDDFIFSDETGFSKPNPEAYTRILEATGCRADESYHIGDRLNTDVKGAREVGMKAIYFTGVSGKSNGIDENIDPDFTCGSWREIREILLQ